MRCITVFVQVMTAHAVLAMQAAQVDNCIPPVLHEV
jgi:hypothetical protein